MGLGGLQKQTALRLIEGLEIELRGGDVSVRFLTVVPFFKARARRARGQQLLPEPMLAHRFRAIGAFTVVRGAV